MKRAQIDKTVPLILAFVGLLVIVLALFPIQKVLFAATEKFDCTLQVRANEIISGATKGKGAPEVDCPSKNEPIPTGSSDAQIKARIADDMVECWDKWGKGQKLLFGENLIYCHVCSRINFTDNQGRVPGFHQYLWDETVPGSELNYFSYLTPFKEGARYSSTELPLTGGDIDKSQTYAVIFYYARGDEQIELLGTSLSENALRQAGGVAGGVSAGIVIGGIVGVAGAAIFCIGTGGIGCAIALGGAKVFTVLSAVAGGGIGSFIQANPPKHAAFLLFREVNRDSIGQLGCQWSP